MSGVVCTRKGAFVILAAALAALAAPVAARAQSASSATQASTPIAMASSPADIVMHAKNATVAGSRWKVEPDASAASGARLRLPDANLAKVLTPLAEPTDYIELSFTAEAGQPYRIWMRGRADRDYWGNDSAFFQFSGTVNQAGAPIYRMGTTSATWLGIEDCSGCGLKGWGWQDNGYGAGVLGPVVYFETSGTQTLRIQPREDGLSIDQVVISAAGYMNTAPGATTSDATILPVAPDAPAAVSAPEVVVGSSSATAFAGGWKKVVDATAAEGMAVWHPDAGAAKLATPLASPVHYVEFTFIAEAQKEYRLWLRGRADRNAWSNDSIFLQFDGSMTTAGVPVARIGTTDGLALNLEDGNGVGLSGWGWQDLGYGIGVLGPLVTFEKSGQQTLRIQTREDGLRIDQIVLSSEKYLTAAPGLLKNDATILLSAAPAPITAPTPAPTPAPSPEPTPDPTPTDPTAPVTLRVLEWNLHHGVGTDGVYNLDRIATWIVKMNPDVVLLNEVEKYTGWGNENQPERYRMMLEAKTGKRWYGHFAQRYGSLTANGQGNLILSTIPFDVKDQAKISYDRVITEAVITVNGRLITLMQTHLDADSQARRLTQARELIAKAAALPENRIIGGDFNAWPDQTSIAEMNIGYMDTWVAASKTGTAVSFKGNSPFGATKSGRIDYIFQSKGAVDLGVARAEVFDTRDAKGVMPSDHRPLLVTFEVR